MSTEQYWGVAQVVEHPTSKYKALELKHQYHKKKKKEEEEEEKE
jgi:hypothetical protein